MVTIDLKEKFTSVNLDNIISEHWQKSILGNTIVFNLSSLEWIAIEQMTFFISWVNTLVNQGKSVSINLQTIKNIDPLSYTFLKRQRCFNYIVNKWRLLDLIDKRVQVISGDIISTTKKGKDIPYYEIPLQEYFSDTFDEDFFNLYEKDLKPFINYIKGNLQENTILNYFDNHYLHYSIIKEFFSNSCQHAFSDIKNKKCFLSLEFNSKISSVSGTLLTEKLKERYSERPMEEVHFFKNKKKFINTSFIEITFLDFGFGISSTLKDKYQNEKFSNIEKLLSSNHLKQNEDTRILEYAFLLFTSKYEIGKDFEIHDYIPRGLYVIKDIVRRYKGMIVVRSKKGKVVFNFRESELDNIICYRQNDNNIYDEEEFPGTSITIVLPAKEDVNETISDPKISYVHENTSSTQIVNLLSLISEIKMNERYNQEIIESNRKLLFHESFFRRIASILSNTAGQNGGLLLFDFAGIERTNQDVFHKFIYFISYCPLVTENIKVCLFNLLDKDVTTSLLGQEIDKKKSLGFFIKPIPCVFPDHTVTWIGINDKLLDFRLTEVWKQDFTKNETFIDIHHLNSNVLNIANDENGKFTFEIILQPYEIILELIHNYHSQMIEKEMSDNYLEFCELKNEDHNYNIVRRTSNNDEGFERAFLTSNGKYQCEFLSFIEKLYIKEYRRLISIYFLFNLFFKKSTSHNDLYKTNKVLTVTLSSQLLGKELVAVMNELSSFESRIDLIPLSSYYDFYTEDPFNEIKQNDNIIVVNDVISTGNLSQSLIDRVNRKKANIVALLTIIDSRTDDDKLKPIESTVVSLLEKSIDKYLQNPFDSTPIWINPILNAPTSMSREKSNLESILIPPQDFVSYFDNDDLFKIGYFQINTRFITYYLQTDLFFKTERKNNFPVISKLLDVLMDRIAKEKILTLQNDLNDLIRIHKRFEELYEKTAEITKNKNTLSLDSNTFTALEEDLRKQINHSKQYSLFENQTKQQFDYIFYPFLSAVSEIEKNPNPISIKLNGNNFIKIFPLPRIMTPKGWRFGFPPKFLNFNTKDKTALILDDGSVTGDTIIQMVDSLSFLELSEIFVLSIFGRLEDFQREFLSRIRQIKVKDKDLGYKIIPVTIFFGTHFHIPVYNKTTNPVYFELKEIEEISNLYTKNGNQIPYHIDSYINSRKSILSSIVNPQYSESISIIKKGANRRLMFVLRDLIGNFDSYRLFKEDEADFNYSKQKPMLKSFKEIIKSLDGKLSLISIVVLEPNLVMTLRRIYPEILENNDEPDNIKSFIQNQIFLAELSIDDLQFFMKALFNIDYTSYLNFPFLVKLLDKIESISNSGNKLFDEIGYYFSTILFKTNFLTSDEFYTNAKLVIQKLYFHINDSGLHGKKYSSLIKELYNESLINIDDFPFRKDVNTFFRIKQYYKKQVSFFDGKAYSSHPNFYAAFSSIINRLGVYIDSPPSMKEQTGLINDLKELVVKTNERLFKELNKALDFLEPFYLYYDLGINIPNYKKLLFQFRNLEKRLNEGESFTKIFFSKRFILPILRYLERFNESFFQLKSELPAFFIKDRTNLYSIINKTISEQEGNHSKTNIFNLIPPEKDLLIHAYLLRLIIYEIIENKCKYSPDSKATFSYREDKKSVRIIFNQLAPFDENKNENGLITIRNIIKRYGGYSSSSSNPNYELNIIFPNKNLILD